MDSIRRVAGNVVASMQTLSVSLLLVLTIQAYAMADLGEPKLVWQVETGAAISATPAFYPSVENPTHVAVGNDAGEAFLLDGSGAVVWRKKLGDGLPLTPAVADVTGDAAPELIFADRVGAVVVVSRDGEVLWRASLVGQASEFRSPCAPDLDGDGKAEIVIGDDAGWLTCFSGDGARLWRTRVDKYRVGLPAVGDVDSDGKPDLVYGTENDRLVGINGNGRLMWLARHEGQFGRAAPALGDVDGDGRYELAITPSYNTAKSRMVVLNAEDGSTAWETPMTLHGYVATCICDIDGDGTNEVLANDRANYVYCFNGDGSIRWKTLTGGQCYFFPPAVADLDGDGAMEVLTSVRDENEDGQSWFVLNAEGEILKRLSDPPGPAMTPMVADINQDGLLEVVLQAGRTGRVACYTFGTRAEGAKRLWVSPRRDAAGLGAWPLAKPAPPVKSTDEVPALDVRFAEAPTWGSNPLTVDWPSNVPEDALLETSVRDPQGRTTTQCFQVRGNGAPPAVSLELLGSGVHDIDVRLWDAVGGKPVAKWHLEQEVGSFAGLADSVEASLTAQRQAAARLAQATPGTAELINSCVAAVQGKLALLKQQAAATDLAQAAQADALLAGIRDFRGRVRRNESLVRIAEGVAAAQPGAPFAAWADPNPWDERDPLEDHVVDQLGKPLALSLYRGEHESGAFNVLNLTGEPLTVQVRPGDAGRDALRLAEVVAVPRRDGSMVSDVLADMNRANTFAVAPGQVRTLWVTVDGRALGTGEHELPVTLLALGAGNATTELAVSAHVADIELSEAPTWWICNWTSPDRLASLGLTEQQQRALFGEMRQHGMNVFTLSLPKRRCNAEGELKGEVDWAELDKSLDIVGPDTFLLFSGDGVTVPAEVEQYGPVHVKAQRAWLTEFALHMEGQGWPRNRWALYPVDEPGLYGGTRIELFRRIATHFREAAPDLWIYTDPSGGVTYENAQPMIGLADVWCPELQLLRRRPELIPLFLKSGKLTWSYEAPGEVKRLLPLGFYRSQNWIAYTMGLDGTGFWTYLYETDNDLFLSGDLNEWGANYTASGVPVPSRRWEAYRDGGEDVRAFMLLEQAVAAARKRGAKGDALAEAETVLEEMVPKLIQPAWQVNDITRLLRDYDMDYTQTLDVRKRVEALTLALRKP